MPAFNAAGVGFAAIAFCEGSTDKDEIDISYPF
jgi:hypothetical protein